MPCSRDWSWSSKVSWGARELPQWLGLSQTWDQEVLLGQFLVLGEMASPRYLSSAQSCPRTSSSPPQARDLRRSSRARWGLLSPNMQV